MMVDVNLLKSEIAKQGMNHKEFCQKVNMNQSTFSRRLRTRKFNTDEADAIIRVLKLKNPKRIFFAKKLT